MEILFLGVSTLCLQALQLVHPCQWNIATLLILLALHHHPWYTAHPNLRSVRRLVDFEHCSHQLDDISTHIQKCIFFFICQWCGLWAFTHLLYQSFDVLGLAWQSVGTQHFKPNSKFSVSCDSALNGATISQREVKCPWEIAGDVANYSAAFKKSNSLLIFLVALLHFSW